MRRVLSRRSFMSYLMLFYLINYLGINRYSDGGELIQEPAGVMLSCGLTDQEADSYAHAYVFPDKAYASLKITGVQYAIDRDSVQD